MHEPVMQIVPSSQCSSIVHSTCGVADTHSPSSQTFPEPQPAFVRQPLMQTPSSQMRPAPPHSLSCVHTPGAGGAVVPASASRPSPSSPSFEPFDDGVTGSPFGPSG